MTLAWQWLGARLQWAWCALFGHPLSVAHKANQNDRWGRVAAVETWKTCGCGQRVGQITRQRYLRPY